MKRSHSFYAVLGLLAWPLLPCRAETSPAGYLPMRIDQTWQPGFPTEATDLDLTSGTATVLVTVNATGQLADSLVVAYSHPAFAEMALIALKKWKYEPARLEGQPLITTREVAFHFEEHGLVLVTATATDAIEEQMHRTDDTSYRAYTLKEIDGVLTPTHLVSPAYPLELRAKGVSGTVTLEYYVDENGKVRMPMVTNRAPPELAGLALQAALQWQFAPPTRHGKPVLVRVSQDVRFRPAT